MTEEITDGNGFKLFEFEAETGRSVWIKHEIDGRITMRVDMPVDSILDQNKEFANDSIGKRFGDWARVASVPLELMDQSGLSEASKQKDDRFISRWLNDSDNRKFRTFRGVV